MFRGLTKCAVIALLACLIVPGCGAIQALLGQNTSGETGKSELKRFASEAELLDYFKSQITARNDSIGAIDRSATEGDAAQPPSAENTGGAGGADSLVTDGSATATPAPGDSDASSNGAFSGTTTQEQGVDEADVVKTDGDNLYVISTRNSDSVLRIVGLSAGGQTQLHSETVITGYGRDLYLRGDKVIAITSGGGFYYPYFLETSAGVDVAADSEIKIEPSDSDPTNESSGGSDSAIETDAALVDGGVAILPPFDQFTYERPYTLITIVDVSNPAATLVLSTTRIDGSVSASRMINGVLHLVMANYQDYYYDVLPRLGALSLDLSSVDTAALLPKYTQTMADGSEETGSIVTWEELYRPTDPDGFGVVTLVSLDVDDDASFSAVGVVAEPGLVYSSPEALYLTDTNYDWQGNTRTTTDVYKFKYEGRGATPVATGTVPGRILNQYSMGESNGNLRIASTIDATFRFDGIGIGTVAESRNGVYVLNESDATLDIIGRVENIAPGETIQSARFIGDRGFLVTFRQVDPFFTMDLSDPANPRVVGELKVPGYSTFLTPIDENHILAVGQYIPPQDTFGNWGVQLSIFDVTDFANPAQTSNVIIGAEANTSAYSEALWDPKAFTYFAEGGVVALPMSIYEYVFFGAEGSGGVTVDSVPSEVTQGDSGGGTTDGDGTAPSDTSGTVESTDGGVFAEPTGFDGIYLFRVSVEEGLTGMGRVSTRFDEAEYWGASFTRGVFVDQDVYAVTDLGVHSASISDPSTEKSRLFFGLPYDIVDTPPDFEGLPPTGAVDDDASTNAETPTSGTGSPDGATLTGGAASGADSSVPAVSASTSP